MNHHFQAIIVLLPSWYCHPISQALTTYLMSLTQLLSIAIRRLTRASSSKTQESYSSFKRTLLTIYSQWPGPYLPPTPTSDRCQKWQLHMWQLAMREAKSWFTGILIFVHIHENYKNSFLISHAAMISSTLWLMMMLEILMSNLWSCVLCGQRTIWWSMKKKSSQISLISMVGC